MRVSPLATLLLLPAALVAALGEPAAAHPLASAGTGAAAGFAHPFGGLDHVLAMVAVGLWAAQLGGRARWLVPGAFVAMMLVGGGLGAAGLGVPAVEAAILASVLALGLLIAFAVRAPVALGMALVGGFALAHGHAHGAAMPLGAGVLYALGFAAATACLHGLGIALGSVARAGAALRWGGAGIAAAGLALILAAG